MKGNIFLIVDAVRAVVMPSIDAIDKNENKRSSPQFKRINNQINIPYANHNAN